MAAFGRNLSHGPQNHAQNRPYNTKQVACRLCDRVLNGTQALISHIESHILQGDIAPIRQNQQYPHQQMLTQPNNQFFFPNPNLVSRFTPASAPPPRPQEVQQQRPVFPSSGGSTAQVLQCPVPLRGPNNLSLTLGRGTTGGAHSVKISLSQLPIVPSRVSLDPASKSRSSKVSKRLRRSMPVAEEAGPSDCTRPFLSQLDHPIPKVVDLEMENEDGLDLTLKL